MVWGDSPGCGGKGRFEDSGIYGGYLILLFCWWH
jgi:hypothetical protein